MSATPVADRKISEQVTNKLASRGVRTPCRVTVQSRNGEVTLSGTVQFANQKMAATQVASGIGGVRRVIDHLVVKPPVKQQ